jgi:hypothetical protein
LGQAFARARHKAYFSRRVARTRFGSLQDWGRGLLPSVEEIAMSFTLEYEHVGETAGCSDHDHDLIAELSRRLDNLWRYDQYIANAEWRDALRQFWMDAKAMEQQAISRLKQLIAQEVRNGCF